MLHRFPFELDRDPGTHVVFIDDEAATAEVRIPQPQVMPRGSGPIAALPIVLNERYELRRRIGSGGMGEVFLGVDRLLEREVAVKVMRGELAHKAYHVERFRREAQLLARVESSRVIQVYDMHFGDDVCYIVMRHVAGRTLNRIVETTGPLEPTAALELANDILEGLCALHAEGLVHRDVKPANVLVDLERRGVLLDLGVALDRRRPGMTPHDMTAGTLAYMAPEQKLTGHVDSRSDVFQVGLLLLYAVLGIDASEHTIDNGLDDTLLLLPGGLADVIARALEREPDARFQTAEAMKAAVVRALHVSHDPEPIEIPLAELSDQFDRLGDELGDEPGDEPDEPDEPSDEHSYEHHLSDLVRSLAPKDSKIEKAAKIDAQLAQLDEGHDDNGDLDVNSDVISVVNSDDIADDVILLDKKRRRARALPPPIPPPRARLRVRTERIHARLDPRPLGLADICLAGPRIAPTLALPDHLFRPRRGRLVLLVAAAAATAAAWLALAAAPAASNAAAALAAPDLAIAPAVSDDVLPPTTTATVDDDVAAGPTVSVSAIDTAEISIDAQKSARIVHAEPRRAPENKPRPALPPELSYVPANLPAEDDALLRSATAYERDGEVRSAITALREYLSDLPDAPNAPEVRAHVRALIVALP